VALSGPLNLIEAKHAMSEDDRMAQHWLTTHAPAQPKLLPKPKGGESRTSDEEGEHCEDKPEHLNQA